MSAEKDEQKNSSSSSASTSEMKTTGNVAATKNAQEEENGQPVPVPVPVATKKLSFFARLLSVLVPCVSSGPVLDDSGSPSNPKPTQKPSAKLSEKNPPLHNDPATVSSNGLPKDTASKVSPSAETPQGDQPASSSSQPNLSPAPDPEGVTSAAVQPPGSTGEPSTSDTGSNPRESLLVNGTGATATAPIGTEPTESDVTYSDEDDEDDILPDDDEDRLILSGGAGIPIGPDGVARPLLPPVAPHHTGRKCLVLDLDETLVHSSFKSIQQADYVVPVEIEYHWHNVYVIKRPGVDNFLKRMGEQYEIVVFTASLSKYADPVLDKLDIHQVVTHRLFRESCYNHKGNYVKDLSQLGRPIHDTIILDNSPASYIFHPNNAVPVSSWFNDPHDTELTDLIPFLGDLKSSPDVRGVLDGAR